MILRPYQNAFVSGVARGFHEGFMRQLGVLPTGGGKTICFANIAQRFHEKRGERTLVLAHREELITQAADKIKQATGLEASIEKAGDHADRSAPVVVASIQTMQGARLESWNPDHFGLIVCDEAHHVLADQWQTTLARFNSRVLGVTATPDRGDKKNLATFFENLAYEIGILDLISQGFLAPVKIKAVPLRIDLADVKSTAGDYDAKALDAAIAPYLSQIARYIAENCQERRRIVTFLPLISTSQRFAEECQAVGIDARHIDGASPDRAEILKGFSAGKFRLLSNAMLLTEGWDEPGVDCLLVLRPTRSRPLYCLDEETEILTKDGWKKDIKIGELVASFCMANGEIKYTPATSTIRREMGIDETWVSIKNQSCDIRVTNNHRMIYDHKRRTGWKFKTAESLAELKDTSYIPAAGFGEKPGVPLTDSELKFIGWVMTDGSINKKNGSISITQGEHQEWLEEIQKCIEDCGLKFTRSKRPRVSQFKSNSDCVKWTISKGKPRGRDKHLKGWGHLEPWISKDISPLLMDMDKRQFSVIAEAIHLGDGSKQKKQKWKRRSYHINTGNIKFAERLQILAITNGFRCSISVGNWNKNPIYTVHIKNQLWNRIGGKSKDRPQWQISPASNGDVCWCIENEAGTIITRRNGKVAIMGNCQMVGRGTRLHPDKKNLLLLDFLWMHERHNLARPASLVAKTKEEEQAITDKIFESDEKDLQEAQNDAAADREAALIREIAANAAKKERFITLEQVGAILKDRKIQEYEPVFGWERQAVTEKQRQVLDRFGLQCRTKGEASMVMNRLFDRSKSKLATVKQLQWLVRYGYPNPEAATATEAKAFLDERWAKKV